MAAEFPITRDLVFSSAPDGKGTKKYHFKAKVVYNTLEEILETADKRVVWALQSRVIAGKIVVGQEVTVDCYGNFEKPVSLDSVMNQAERKLTTGTPDEIRDARLRLERMLQALSTKETSELVKEEPKIVPVKK